jgi:hypothetical protein
MNAVEIGIQDEELRKMRADLDATLENTKATNVTFKNIYGKGYRLPLRFELIDDPVALPTNEIQDEIMFELRINTKEYILKYGNDKKDVVDFKMNDIHLEFATLDSPAHLSAVKRTLQIGFPFLFDHVHHLWDMPLAKKTTKKIIDIETDRRSLKGILLIFQDKFTPGARDSEYFPNPKITRIKLTVDNVTNKLYKDSTYMMKYQWGEIILYFVPEEFKRCFDIYMDKAKYYSGNKFALWVDLRSSENNNIHGTGKSQQSSPNIKMEITKEAENSDDEYTVHAFVIADARVISKGLDKITFKEMEL